MMASLTLSAIVLGDVKLYVVNTNEEEGLVTVSEDSLGLYGYRKKEPDLVIRKLDHAIIEEHPLYTRPKESEEKKTYHLSIGWSDPDSERFYDLTKRSIQKRILFVVDGTPIYAPIIVDGISEPTVWVTFREKEQAEAILRRLEPLVVEDGENKTSQTTAASAAR